MFEFQASQGSMGLKLAVDFFGAGHNFTRLVPDLSDGKDPDDAFSRIPYEKVSASVGPRWLPPS